MNFTEQFLTADGEQATHNENYKDDKGVIANREAPLTYFKVVREALLGQVGGRIINSPRFVAIRFKLFEKIRDNQESCKLSPFEKWLVKGLMAKRFDVTTTARLLEKL